MRDELIYLGRDERRGLEEGVRERMEWFCSGEKGSGGGGVGD